MDDNDHTADDPPDDAVAKVTESILGGGQRVTYLTPGESMDHTHDGPSRVEVEALDPENERVPCAKCGEVELPPDFGDLNEPVCEPCRREIAGYD